ncbi:MAG: DNA repair protein RecO [Clostridia bacterium]|nr:DNA repair protein RecO [Clostridia bacterium]
MSEKTSGVIIKQSGFGEGHRMLWIFTEKYGIVKAVVHGADKTKSKSGGSTQFLSYCDFDFFDNGEVWNIKNVSSKDSFWPIQEDLTKLALCTYFADLIYTTLELHNPDSRILRLFLNTLYACAYRKTPLNVMKLIFETKLLFFSGMLPSPAGCISCGTEDEICYFDKLSGGVLCSSCGGKASHIKIDESTYKVYYLIVYCDIKKMFSYQLPEKSVLKLSSIMESFVLSVTDKKIKSLEYYKKLL